MLKLYHFILIVSVTVVLLACGNTVALPEKLEETSTSPILFNTSPLPTPSKVAKEEPSPEPLPTPSKQVKEEPSPEPLPTTAKAETVAPLFSADKFNLVPYQFEIPPLPDSALKQVDGPIRVNSWSHTGAKMLFGYRTAERRFDPTAKDNKALTGHDGYYFNVHRWIANADGSNAQKIDEWTNSFNIWSPDDSHLLYKKKTGVSNESFWVVDLNTMTHTELAIPPGEVMEETHFYGDVFWLDNEHLLYPTYGADKSRTLWRHNVTTNELQVVTVNEAIGYPWRSINLSPDGKYVVGRTEGTIWLGKIVTLEDQIHLNYVRTLFTDSIAMFYWAPNSHKLAIKFLDMRQQILHIADIYTEEIVKIEFVLKVRSVLWSPDSEMLIVTNYPSGTSMVTPVYVVNADGSQQRLFWQDGYSNYLEWSLDGQFLIWYQDDNPQHLFKVVLK